MNPARSRNPPAGSYTNASDGSARKASRAPLRTQLRCHCDAPRTDTCLYRSTRTGAFGVDAPSGERHVSAAGSGRSEATGRWRPACPWCCPED